MLGDPPRDNDGVVVPHDHADISDDDVIIKRVSPNDIHTGQDGIIRIATTLFGASSDKYSGSSINIAKIIEANGLTIEAYCSQFPNVVGAISVPASSIRKHGAKVGFEPLENDRAHGEIWDLKGKSNIKDLMRECRIEFGLENLTCIYPAKKD